MQTSYPCWKFSSWNIQIFFFFWNSPRDCQNAPFMYLMSALNDTTSEEISCATDLRKLKIACLRHLPAGSVS